MSARRHGLSPAWFALVVLPLVLLVDRLGGTPPNTLVPLADPSLVKFGGLVFTALLSTAVGPHLATLAALAVTALGSVVLASGIGPGGIELVDFGQQGVLLGVIASGGASASGAAPGLRYAILLAIYVAANAAILVPSTAVPTTMRMGLPILASVLMLIATASWWAIEKHPARGDQGASERTVWVALAVGVIVAVTVATTELLWSTIGPDEVAFSETANIVAVVGFGVPLTLLFVGLQIFNRPARLGLGAGAGALILSLTAVLGWSTQAVSGFISAFILGLGEVLLFPWAYARATSDAHWRLAGPLAVLVLAPPLALTDPPTLVPVAGALVLAMAAIPIGMLGWVGDEWVFGEEPGSVKARR